MSERAGAAATFVLAGLTLLVMAWRGATGRLRRNPFFGLRTGATMSSDEAWEVAHRVAARPTAYAGAASIAGGLLAAVAGGNPTALVVIGGVTSVAIVTPALLGAARGDRAARHLRD
ncbi:MAG TPA: SdpI family protein [Frankiaceae bacterium]|nr:SdpI family protein [Frankiaceae bacterium]